MSGRAESRNYGKVAALVGEKTHRLLFAAGCAFADERAGLVRRFAWPAIKTTQRYFNITDEALRKALTSVWERRRQLKAVSGQASA